MGAQPTAVTHVASVEQHIVLGLGYLRAAQAQGFVQRGYRQAIQVLA